MQYFTSPPRVVLLLTLGSLAIGVAACGARDEDKVVATSGATATPEHSDMAGMQGMEASPFMAVEMAMKKTMAAAVGETAEQTWALKMIAHHQSAIDMSRALLARSAQGPMQAMAQKTIDDQTKDIAELKAWTKGRNVRAGGSVDPFMKAEMKMHERMMQASSPDVDQAWALKMIPHHEGAVDMSKTLLESAKDPELRRIAMATLEKQTKEVEMLREMAKN